MIYSYFREPLNMEKKKTKELCLHRRLKKSWELLLNTSHPELPLQEFHPISHVGKAGNKNNFYWELLLQVLPVGNLSRLWELLQFSGFRKHLDIFSGKGTRDEFGSFQKCGKLLLVALHPPGREWQPLPGSEGLKNSQLFFFKKNQLLKNQSGFQTAHAHVEASTLQ